MSISRSALLLSLVFVAGIAGRSCDAARIEAVEGKEYRLSDRHGPWMIMVARLYSAGNEGESAEGTTAEEAANALVYELRTKGLPAYVYVREADDSPVTTRDRLGQVEQRHNLHAGRSICVIAGNYASYQDEVAQRTLEWVKSEFEPKSLLGAVYTKTEGRPRPLSGAFLTINPLLNPEEVAARTVDPLLVRLNSGVQHSLGKNTGKYTLVVAHFGGKTAHLGNGLSANESARRESGFLVDDDLDVAAEQANALAAALRQDLDPQGRFKNLDAYVWHSRYESLVTVGSFASQDDPAIAHYQKLFGAERNPTGGQPKYQFLMLQDQVSGEQRLWTFVPTPQVMAVPRLR